MRNFIAYDLGTGGIKASLFNENGDSLSDLFIEYETFFPADQFIEQRPMDWWNNVCKATKMLLTKTGVNPNSIACVALSGHSLVAVPLDINGNLLADQVPIWCDMRAKDQVRPFFEKLSYESWYETTGNGDPAECYTILKTDVAEGTPARPFQ